MDITYFGVSSFKIKGKTATLVTDPYSPEMVGLKFPKTEADIVTVSHQHEDYNNVQTIEGSPFVINQPGEYEVKGVSIFGFPSSHKASDNSPESGSNIIYVIEADGLRIGHLGDLGAIPSTKIMEEIIGVDILMVPVGGIYTLDPKEAVEVITQIEPHIILPMHYKAAGMKEENFSKLSTLEDFLSQMGAEQAERLDKLSVTKDKLPEETKVVVLERKA